MCKFEAEVTVPRYLQQTMSQLDPLQESHTTSNEVRAAQPSCEAEWIFGLCYEGKMTCEAQPWPSPGLKDEGPGLPKVDTCPRDALDRPKTDPQYARNSSGKGLDTLEHAPLEKNSRCSHLAIKNLIHSRTKCKFTTKSVNLLCVFDMAVARILLFAIAISRFFIQLRTESKTLQGLQKVILPQIRFGRLKKHAL